MARPVSNGLVEINGAKSDENGFGCMKLIEFLTKDGVADWDEWHYRHNQASLGECYYSDRCPIYAKTANKFLPKI
jgi:hypothetical protein